MGSVMSEQLAPEELPFLKRKPDRDLAVPSFFRIELVV